MFRLCNLAPLMRPHLSRAFQPELPGVLGRPVSASDTCNGTHRTVAKSIANFNTNPYTLNINCPLYTYAACGMQTLLGIRIEGKRKKGKQKKGKRKKRKRKNGKPKWS